MDYVISYACNSCRSAKRKAISSWTGSTLTSLLLHEMAKQSVTSQLTVVSNVFSVEDAIRTSTVKVRTTTRRSHSLHRPALHHASAQAPGDTPSTTTNTMTIITEITAVSPRTTTSISPASMI